MIKATLTFEYEIDPTMYSYFEEGDDCGKQLFEKNTILAAFGVCDSLYGIKHNSNCGINVEFKEEQDD